MTEDQIRMETEMRERMGDLPIPPPPPESKINYLNRRIQFEKRFLGYGIFGLLGLIFQIGLLEEPFNYWAAGLFFLTVFFIYPAMILSLAINTFARRRARKTSSRQATGDCDN